jgi:methionyl-tRNA formyltransferase
MNICIAGKNLIAIKVTEYLLNKLLFSKDNLMIIPNKDDSGVNNWQPSFKKYATDNEIKIVQLELTYKIDNLIFLSLEFDIIIKPSLFKSKNLFNIHFSLLPKYRGVYTSIYPILNGEKFSGVTLHLIDKGIDTGDIIEQLSFRIGNNHTSRDLYHRYLKYGIKLMNKNLIKILNGNYKTFSQNHLDSSYYRRDSINFKKIEINLNKTSVEIFNQIRAFIFPEYQLPKLRNNFIYKTILYKNKIGLNQFIEKEELIILSGNDGYKIEAYKEKESIN